MRQERQRLFFAAWPDAPTLAALLAAQTAIEAPAARAMPAANLHITLAFVGEVPAARQAELQSAAAALPPPPCGVLLDRFEIGKFGLWLEAQDPPDALARWRRRLLEAAGCDDQSRRFRPHVTLYRKLRACRLPQAAPAVRFDIERFALVRSTLTPQGSIYQRLHDFPPA